MRPAFASAVHRSVSGKFAFTPLLLSLPFHTMADDALLMLSASYEELASRSLQETLLLHYGDTPAVETVVETEVRACRLPHQ